MTKITNSQSVIVSPASHTPVGGFFDFIAKASIAGSVSAVVSAGLNGVDVTKIRMQNQAASGKEAVYTGLLNGMHKIYREEGWKGLSKGIYSSMLRELSYTSIRMGAYEPIRAILTTGNNDPTNSNPLIKFTSGLISGGVGSAIANPFDLIKTRFQAVLPGEVAPYKSTLSAITTIYNKNGFSGLYRGWIVTSSRAAVLTSAQLGSYDSIKHNLLINMLGMKEGFVLHLVASMSAGIITTTAANPFDVVKTRYLSDHDHTKYSTISDCVWKTFSQEGFRAFFKGWTAAYWRLGPHTVLSLLLIEEIRTLVGMNNM
eukprot:gene14920-20069_t